MYNIEINPKQVVANSAATSITVSITITEGKIVRLDQWSDDWFTFEITSRDEQPLYSVYTGLFTVNKNTGYTRESEVIFTTDTIDGVRQYLNTIPIVQRSGVNPTEVKGLEFIRKHSVNYRCKHLHTKITAIITSY